MSAAPGAAAGLPRPRALIFDWDNTLVDSWPVIHDALNVTLTAFGLAPWSLAETKERVRLSLRDSFPRLFGARWPEARQLYLDTFRAQHLERLAVLPGVPTLLEQLKGEGLYLAVVSNKTGAILRAEARHLGWGRYFARFVGAGDAAADKPAKDPVYIALEGSGVPPGEHVWFVGDTALDIECARNAACVPVLLGAFDPAAAEFTSAQPRLAFDDCNSLFLALRTL
jgi:phosphoglycolate phosphatase